MSKILINNVNTGSLTMDYCKFGVGIKALVILPGLSVQSVMGSASAIAEAYHILADDFTIYVFDRRKELPESCSIQNMARDTISAIHALGLENVSIFGASQGGMIAMEIAIMEPELVNKLVLGSVTAKVTSENYSTFEKWINLAKAGNAADLYLSFGKALYPEEVFNALREPLSEAAKAVTSDDLDRFIILANSLNNFDITDELQKIVCPVLVINSADDRVFGKDAGYEIKRIRPDFELYMYDSFGHAAYDTAPDYKERLSSFLTA